VRMRASLELPGWIRLCNTPRHPTGHARRSATFIHVATSLAVIDDRESAETRRAITPQTPACRQTLCSYSTVHRARSV